MKKVKSIVMAILILAVTMFASIVTGCGKEADLYDVKYDKNGNVIVSVWSAYPLYPKYKSDYSNPASSYYAASKYTKWVIDSFQEKNPGYVIQLVDMGWGESLNNKIQTASISNTLPDLLAGEVYISKYIDLGILSPMDVSDDIVDDLVEGTIRDGIKDGEVYALPVMTGAYALYYNKTVLEEAGITEIPTTWEGVLAAAKKVEENGDNGFLVCNAGNLANAFQALVFMASAGGDFVDAKGNLTLNSAANLKAFNMISELSKTAEPGITSKSQDELKTKFFNGDCAFMIEGSKYYATAKDSELKNSKCDIGVAPLPVFEGDNIHANVISGNLCFSLIKYSPNKEIALKFLEYLMSKEVMEEAFKIDGRIPTRKSVISGIQNSKDAEIQKLYAKTSCYIDSIANDRLTSVPGFVNNSSNIWDKFNAMMGTVVSASSNSELIQKTVKEAHTYIEGKM